MTQSGASIPFVPFEEYREMLKHCIMMKRENGILEARLHTDGDSMQWGAPAHQGLHVFFDLAGRDLDNEVIILGGTGKDFIKSMGKADLKEDEETKEFESQGDDAWKHE